jgi:hypothetical protein
MQLVAPHITVSICTSVLVKQANCSNLRAAAEAGGVENAAYVSIRQHTSAYVSICQHTSGRGRRKRSIRQHTSAYVSIRQHTSAYVSIRQHTSAYVSKTQLVAPHTAAPYFALFVLSKASKASACASATRYDRQSSVSTRNFVLVKQVKRVNLG